MIKSPDDEYKEIHQDWLQESVLSKKSPLLLDPNFFYIAGLIVFIVLYFTLTRKIVKLTDLIPYIILILVLFFLLRKTQKDGRTKIIPEKIAKAIVKGEIKGKQRTSPEEFGGTEATITIYPACKLQMTLDDGVSRPWMWRVGVRVDASKGTKIYTVGVDPYKGYIIEISETPQGFRPDDTPHVIFKQIKQDPNTRQQKQ